MNRRSFNPLHLRFRSKKSGRSVDFGPFSNVRRRYSGVRLSGPPKEALR